MNPTYRSLLESPIGWLAIEASDHAITGIAFVTAGALPEPNESNLTNRAKVQLEGYFAGKRQTFDLPLAPPGTDFQKQCWRALQAIPFGDTRSYAEQARSIDRPKAVRAVGSANGANPIAIVIPCHRVIGTNGRLTGYAGGLDRKAWLLALENAQSALFE
ncbi:MAG: methylated-DNA--[protein]-cysteine S-methyltransferase [Saccharospirillum sp.]